MTAVKDDNGKPPVRYFYFAGLAAMRPENSATRVLALGYEDLVKALIDKERTGKNECVKLAEITLASMAHSFKIPPTEVLKEVSYVSKLGADKYGIFNYQSGMKWSRLVDALGRHLLHYTTEDFIDEESLMDHRYHMLANLFMLAYFIENQVGDNDLKETTNE